MLLDVIGYTLHGKQKPQPTVTDLTESNTQEEYSP